MKRLRRTVKQLIRPLKKQLGISWVWLFFKHDRKAYMRAVHIGPLRIISIDAACRKASRHVIEYLLLHELLHLKYPKMDERDIDLKVIELGYIEGLIAFHEWHNRKYKKYTKKDGLTLKEIEKIRKVKHGVYEVIKVDQKKLQEG